MAITNTGRITVSGEYNRAADLSLGVAGTIVTGVKIPRLALVCSFQAFVITPLTTSGANTVSFGFSTTDLLVPIQDGIIFLGATALPWLIPPTVFANAALPILPVRMFNSVNLVMVIGGAGAITGGRIGFILEYFNTDI